MANTLLTPTAITREALRILHNNLCFVREIDKQHDGKVEFGGQKSGGSIQIRKPPQYTVRTGTAINVQDSTETQTTLSINTQKGVDLEFTAQDLTLSIDDFSKRFIMPAMARLASAVDADAFSMYKDVYNLVGTPGTTPASALVYLQGGQRLDDLTAPRDGMRKVVINPAANASTVDGLKGLFNSQADIGKQYKTGEMGNNILGIDKWCMSQNVPVLTTGSRTGTILVDDTTSGNIAEGMTTIHVDGLGGATQTFKEGDVFTIASVFAVNPETKQTLPFLQQFVVQADATAAGSEVDLTISPAIYSSASGGLQNVSALPADDAAVTVVGSASTNYPQNMIFHQDAFTFATADLVVPKGVDFAAREVYDGISLRIVRDYDINNDNFPCRIDVLYGYVAQRPEWATRIIG